MTTKSAPAYLLTRSDSTTSTIVALKASRRAAATLAVAKDENQRQNTPDESPPRSTMANISLEMSDCPKRGLGANRNRDREQRGRPEAGLTLT